MGYAPLKRLKTYLRATMLEERLTGLALLHIHQDIIVPIDEIIDRFANLGPHRLAYTFKRVCNFLSLELLYNI